MTNQLSRQYLCLGVLVILSIGVVAVSASRRNTYTAYLMHIQRFLHSVLVLDSLKPWNPIIVFLVGIAGTALLLRQQFKVYVITIVITFVIFLI